ncbi:hypothetical protein GORHZ_203_00100 [Gordonia rhizosphera NBRC 16068]|uniref:Uncharacterized protein n=1 Tax=Gordonia rhizosphera NBRC 16068 TaxID=1108045 RepID=K6W1K4_9ACTN|nr:hypothetical protein GORHZ_203_00100 [Gordonia rhizosphera NBRC 16068]
MIGESDPKKIRKMCQVHGIRLWNQDFCTSTCGLYSVVRDVHPIGHSSVLIVQHEKVRDAMTDPVLEMVRVVLAIPPAADTTCGVVFRSDKEGRTALDLRAHECPEIEQATVSSHQPQIGSEVVFDRIRCDTPSQALELGTDNVLPDGSDQIRL